MPATMKLLPISIAMLVALCDLVLAAPETDRKAVLAYYQDRFPALELNDYGNGAYALSEDAYAQWQEIEEFPPYEFAVEEGQALFETPFSDGATYASCFANGGVGIRQDYPRFDPARGEVITLELAINECRAAHGESPLPYKKGDLAVLSAYMAHTSRGQVFNIQVEGEPALAAYEAGKQFYYSKRGQLNFSCADCHMRNVCLRLRADQLSPSLGHPTHFPVYRSKWGEMGTLQRRFAGCNRQVRAVPLPAQSPEYRNLEYFLTYMSNGLVINGPGSRK